MTMYINAAYHYLPGKIIPNSYYTDLIDLTDEWIYKRSGIRTRTKADIDENTNTMSIDAVKSGIDKLPYDLKKVDLIVGATYTPYDTVATNAHAVQSYFAISRAKALSISSACSSFLNAVEVVEGYFAINKSQKALVVASEHNTAYSDDMDKQSGYLWGDGAGALLISKERISEEDIEILDLNTTGLADVGRGLEGVYLRPNNGGLQMPYGKDIFVHACKHMVAEVENILKKNNFTMKDIEHFIPHQANSRIINKVAETLGLTNGKLVMNIEDSGNTGSASTAIALSQNWNKFKKGELIVITVFGGGYSSGAMLLKK
jgi:3-oxoacyl-[acyl-carrier-protein] synthase III